MISLCIRCVFKKISNIISKCIQCICNVYLRKYIQLSKISARQWTIMGLPGQVNLKNMCINCLFNVYSMCIQCVFNVYSMCIQCVFIVYSMCIHCLFNVYSMCIQCVFIVYSMCIHCLFNVYSMRIQCVTMVVQGNLISKGTNLRAIYIPKLLCLFDLHSAFGPNPQSTE